MRIWAEFWDWTKGRTTSPTKSTTSPDATATLILKIVFHAFDIWIWFALPPAPIPQLERFFTSPGLGDATEGAQAERVVPLCLGLDHHPAPQVGFLVFGGYVPGSPIGSSLELTQCWQSFRQLKGFVAAVISPIRKGKLRGSTQGERSLITSFVCKPYKPPKVDAGPDTLPYPMRLAPCLIRRAVCLLFYNLQQHGRHSPCESEGSSKGEEKEKEEYREGCG